MCGIAGIIDFTGGKIATDALRRMNAAQAHRGPDGDGLWLSPDNTSGPRAGLGHVRLKIIDLVTGEQPMANEDGSLLLVTNGEIYNFRELRRELEGRGHRFRSGSDSEVILHLYEEMGPECVSRLEGMFAIALWDAKKGTLFLARDRLGVKPLFYYRRGSRLLFASEIKALLASGEVPRELDEVSFHRYLTYFYVPGPETIFRGVRELPPAHRLTASATGGEPERWWRPSFEPKEQLSFDEAVERTGELLSAAVSRRLVSDRPLGVWLSGGIDSSLIAALMAETSKSGDGPSEVRSFSIGFGTPEYDESAHARAAAEALGTTHQEYTVEPDAAGALPRLAWLFDQPFGDSSALPVYRLAEKTREEVVVALSGDGGDESFAGYERYIATRLAGRLALSLPRFLRRRLFAPLLSLGGEPRRWGLRRALRWVNRASLLPKRKRYAGMMAAFSPEEKAALYTDEFAERLGSAADPEELIAEAMAASGAVMELDRMLAADLSRYLPGDLLVKADRMSMAFALEVRDPFLDRELVEFAARLPVALKATMFGTKRILRALAAKKLPPEVAAQLARRRKQGFGVPVGAWFRGDLRELARGLFAESRLAAAGLLRREAMLGLLERHQSAREDLGPQLWGLVMAELWYRTYMEREDVSAPLPAL